jgi:carbon monoxide dehydrogenase subunit G
VRYTASIEIARPPEDVFSYVADLANLPAWQQSARSAEAEGELGVGVTFVETREFLGREVESHGEVTAFEPGRELSLRITGGPVQLTVRHVFEASGDGTRLTIEAEGEPAGMLRLAGPLAQRAARRQADDDLRRLKRILESA